LGESLCIQLLKLIDCGNFIVHQRVIKIKSHALVSPKYVPILYSQHGGNPEAHHVKLICHYSIIVYAYIWRHIMVCLCIVHTLITL